MQELRYKKIEEIKQDSPLIGVVNFKYNLAPIVCIIFGVGIMFVSSIIAKLLGAFFILMAVFVIKYVKDKPVMKVFTDGALIYKPDDENYAYYLKYEDIVQWEVNRDNGKDTIIFKFPDENKLVVETFQLNKAYDYLMKVCQEKEIRYIQHEKNKKMKWANPIDTLRNLGKKFSKKK